MSVPWSVFGLRAVSSHPKSLAGDRLRLANIADLSLFEFMITSATYTTFTLLHVGCKC